MLEYMVVTEEGALELADTINHLITFGWSPAGGVSVAIHGYQSGESFFLYAQAMTREKR